MAGLDGLIGAVNTVDVVWCNLLVVAGSDRVINVGCGVGRARPECRDPAVGPSRPLAG